LNSAGFKLVCEKVRRLLDDTGIDYAFALVGERDGAMGGVSICHLTGDCCEEGLVALSVSTRETLRLALDTAPEGDRERLAHLFCVAEIPVAVSKEAVKIIWQDL